MTRSLHLDFESRSACDLRRCGAYVYFDDPTTGIWCMAYAFDDEPVDLWIPGEPCPADIAEHIRAGGRLVAHNAAFERLAFLKIMGPRYGWPVPRNDQWFCTMAMALAQALPGALEDVATVLRSPVQKDAVGARLMKQMMRPRKIRGDDGLHWWGTPDRLPRLYAYCRQDVEAEREVEKRLLPLSEREQALWVLDQEINDRGVGVDAPLCTAALCIVDEQRERLDRRMREITAGEIVSTTAVAQIKAYLRDRHGINVDDGLAKDIVAALLIRDDLPANAREVLELRKEGSRSSVSKIDALLNGMQSDSSTRGLLQFHAASTGRWCLAEGTMILIRRNGQVSETPIETLKPTDEVWDGDEWVSHEGVVFSGEKDVIEHDGLCATKEHVVYLDDQTSISFGEARDKGLQLWRGN